MQVQGLFSLAGASLASPPLVRALRLQISAILGRALRGSPALRWQCPALRSATRRNNPATLRPSAVCVCNPSSLRSLWLQTHTATCLRFAVIATRKQEKPDANASLFCVGLFLPALRLFGATPAREVQTQTLRSFASAPPSPGTPLLSLCFRVRCFPSSLRDMWKHLTLPLRSYSATLWCVHLSWFASLSKKGGRTPAPLHAPLPHRRSVQTANRYAANRLH